MVQFNVFVFTSKLFFKYESLENEKMLNNWFSPLRVLFEVTDQVLVGERGKGSHSLEHRHWI